MKIYTIGHSTHSKDSFINMLLYVDIEVLADVRAFPGSDKFPQFNQETFKKWLAEIDVDYEHFPLLGGRRNRSGVIQEELNNEWNNQSFHNYADYTLTKDFQTGVKRLKEKARKKNAVICCSERHPARCHRLLISNWFTAQGWEVYHIIEQGKNIFIEQHELGKWGALPILERDGTVVYPET